LENRRREDVSELIMRQSEREEQKREDKYERKWEKRAAEEKMESKKLKYICFKSEL
jgi:hypothetical protein